MAHRIEITKSAFEPFEAVIFGGDAVFWVNVDDETHWPSLLDGPVLPGASSKSVAFSEEPSFVEYVCNLHGEKTGQITIQARI